MSIVYQMHTYFLLSVSLTNLKNAVFISLRHLVDCHPLQGHTKGQPVCKQVSVRKYFFPPGALTVYPKSFVFRVVVGEKCFSGSLNGGFQ
jgi:hypothetical protein